MKVLKGKGLITVEEFAHIIEKDCCADLSGVVLAPGSNLSGWDLHGLKMPDAILRGVNLSNADLGMIKLDRADLEGAILLGAKLSGAYLKGANCERAICDYDIGVILPALVQFGIRVPRRK